MPAAEASQPVSRAARAERAAAPPAGLRSTAQCKKKSRKLFERILAKADELEDHAKQAYLQQLTSCSSALSATWIR